MPSETLDVAFTEGRHCGDQAYRSRRYEGSPLSNLARHRSSLRCDALGVPAERAMFVGDQIDADVVGGNRLGMVTVHIASGHDDTDIDAFGDDPITTPAHRLESLRGVVDLVI